MPFQEHESTRNAAILAQPLTVALEFPEYVSQALHQDGFLVVHDVFNEAETAALSASMHVADRSDSARRRGEMYALRNVLEIVPEVARLAVSASLRRLVEPVLGSGCFPVRGILFDKRPEANWRVPWHQDLTIAVQRTVEVAGFGPWSEKAGVPHVQPPATIMEGLLAARIHLDDCGPDNGPLKVLPGSHRQGRLSACQVEEWRRSAAPVTCAVPRGGVLLMHPLLLHASSPAQAATHRRVVHIEYAAEPLPGGLEWRSCLNPT